MLKCVEMWGIEMGVGCSDGRYVNHGEIVEVGEIGELRRLLLSLHKTYRALYSQVNVLYKSKIF